MSESESKLEGPQGKATISFDEFLKLDMRIATVLEAADHPNADKLLVLNIDIGGQQRQIIAGLKGHYSAESLVGKQVVVVANLAPRKMRGLESQGMLLAATSGEGEQMQIVVLCPERQVAAGAGVS